MNRTAIAMALATLGTIVMFAGLYQLIPSNLSSFATLALYMLSGLAWWLPWGHKHSDRE